MSVSCPLNNRAAEYFRGKKVIVTGGIGSVGKKIVEQLLTLDVARVRVIDNNESGLFDQEMLYRREPRLEFFHADICDQLELDRTFAGMDLCFHAAALKHVPSCERSPFSAINTNITGVTAVIRAAIGSGLEKVLFTSSDKAVNPTNVMGTSKLMGERLFTASNFMDGNRSNQQRTVFSSTRFGNVAGSRGSVVPLFCQQIAGGGPVTLTDARMSRFMMSQDDAARLVIESMVFAQRGEVFITKMPVLRIKDLARVMIEMIAPLHGHDPNAIPITVTGSRPGEKLWEELSTDEESQRLLESERYLIVLPALADKKTRESYRFEGLETQSTDSVYHSDRETPMTDGEIREFLLTPQVLADHLRTALLGNDN